MVHLFVPKGTGAGREVERGKGALHFLRSEKTRRGVWRGRPGTWRPTLASKNTDRPTGASDDTTPIHVGGIYTATCPAEDYLDYGSSVELGEPRASPEGPFGARLVRCVRG